MTPTDPWQIAAPKSMLPQRTNDHVEMDMTRLSFPDNSFDLVVEKATLDSLLVDAKSPWNLTSPGHKLVSKALRQVDCD